MCVLILAYAGNGLNLRNRTGILSKQSWSKGFCSTGFSEVQREGAFRTKTRGRSKHVQMFKFEACLHEWTLRLQSDKALKGL